MFKFVVSFISALETDNNQSVVMKLYDTEFIFWPIFVLHAYVFGT